MPPKRPNLVRDTPHHVSTDKELQRQTDIANYWLSHILFASIAPLDMVDEPRSREVEISGTHTKDTVNFYPLELENEADKTMLGLLLTDQHFLDELAQRRTSEYKMREIFKTPHIYFITETKKSSSQNTPHKP